MQNRKTNRDNNRRKEYFPQQHHALMAWKEQPRTLETEWQLDSACSTHMTNDNSCLEEVIECNQPIFLAETHRSIEATQQGNIKIVSNENSHVELQDVLYVPNQRCNLLSVSSIVNKGNKVIFDQNGATILSEKEEIITTGIMKNNMFKVTFKPEVVKESEKCMHVSSDNMELWHKRLGHINSSYLMRMHKNKMVKGLEDLKGELPYCVSCNKGKITKAEGSPSLGETTARPLERIHVDMYGPLTPTIGGRKYMLTIVDQYTRRYFIEILHSKDEATSNIENFIKRREKETGMKVKKLRSDNGGEFINTEMKNFLESKGIKHEKT
ncbi:hypothetical protein LAZ67_4004302 [Cordylochernes scorpioides]|uniref:Integrase catalytic domain-containing protein n=1 Tax=Cordylochernes scorpioides TaxID=51811 RepID=A0ABY6KFI4_9ARAC|nr:hypothetical protein LAZ67_4004302 [Cordylochernes scorpioides]